jgi:hypothetical protein
MEVDVQFQPTPEPLRDGDRAAAPVGNAGAAGAAAIPTEYGTDETPNTARRRARSNARR